MKQTELQRKSHLRRSTQLERSAKLKRRKPIRVKSKTRTEIEQLDDLLRQIVLIRDQFKCRRCGAKVIAGRGHGLQVAHLLPKGQYPALRHDLQNVMLMCWSCHLGPKGWHKNPLESWEWVRETMGPNFVENLRWLAQTRSHVDKAGTRLWLEMELARLSEHTAPNPAQVHVPVSRSR